LTEYVNTFTNMEMVTEDETEEL